MEWGSTKGLGLILASDIILTLAGVYIDGGRWQYRRPRVHTNRTRNLEQRVSISYQIISYYTGGVYIYIYIYICLHIFICIYKYIIYTYIL